MVPSGQQIDFVHGENIGSEYEYIHVDPTSGAKLITASNKLIWTATLTYQRSDMSS